MWRWIKTCGVPAIGLSMGPHSATLHIISMLRQTRSGLPDSTEEHCCLAIGMGASSQETVHMWGQDVTSIDCVQELITIGASAPYRHKGGMTGGTLGQLLGSQPLRM